MRQFIQRHQGKILGVLSGLDRVRFRASLSLLMSCGGMMSFLRQVGVLLKDFMDYAQSITQQIRTLTEQWAQKAGRPVRYLERMTRKEELVEQILHTQGVAPGGLIAVLSTIETCRSYDIRHNRATHRLDMRSRMRQCLHYYFYFRDTMFGQTPVRLQTWFPFNVNVLLNGREWLARRLDSAGIGYLRRDNCFVQIEDFARAQRFADAQVRINWPKHLARLVDRVHPLHRELFAQCPGPYYWSVEQSEWATDIAFRTSQMLSDLYPQLLRHGIDSFQSPDVMRFLGHKMPAHGGVHGNFAGQVVSDLKQRPEGVRIKHRSGSNSVKMYDKQGSVLRVETTINNVSGFAAFRRPSDQPDAERRWMPMRKGVADMARRAELSQASNARYLDAMAAVDPDTPIHRLSGPLCQPVRDDRGRRHRALNPLSEGDAKLLQAISRGEFRIAGFRNRQLRETLLGQAPNDKERRRQAGRISRMLKLLRAHGLIRKIQHTHRYLLTQKGLSSIPALLAVREATVGQLTAA